jgi:hypothetical protein
VFNVWECEKEGAKAKETILKACTFQREINWCVDVTIGGIWTMLEE